MQPVDHSSKKLFCTKENQYLIFISGSHGNNILLRCCICFVESCRESEEYGRVKQSVTTSGATTTTTAPAATPG